MRVAHAAFPFGFRNPFSPIVALARIRILLAHASPPAAMNAPQAWAAAPALAEPMGSMIPVALMALAKFDRSAYSLWPFTAGGGRQPFMFSQSVTACAVMPCRTPLIAVPVAW